jgi:PilZ domain-containing protein
MAFDETSDGAAYLSALKSGSSQATGAATARAPEPVSPAETPAQVAPPNRPSAVPAERRKSPRYKCKGSARLHENATGVTTWATFADISMHGCYVEAASTLPLGAVLGLRLEVNGLRVEAVGEVRVAYPSLGMGIRFIQMSEPDRERLRELVRSILRSSTALGGTRAPAPPPQSDALRAVANPHAVLQAMLTFFEDRQMMGREEFLRILRKNQ